MKAITFAARSVIQACSSHSLKCCSLVLALLFTGFVSAAQVKAIDDLEPDQDARTCKKFVPVRARAVATLNIFGQGDVTKGQTYQYYVYPSYPNSTMYPYTPHWDDEGYLMGMGQVGATWQSPDGTREYCEVFFGTTGSCFLTYYGPYNGFMDWGEIAIEIYD